MFFVTFLSLVAFQLEDQAYWAPLVGYARAQKACWAVWIYSAFKKEKTSVAKTTALGLNFTGIYIINYTDYCLTTVITESLRPPKKIMRFLGFASYIIIRFLRLHHTNCFSFSISFMLFSQHSLVELTFKAVLSWNFQIFKIVKMGRKKSSSEVQRGQIVALHGEGLSELKISAKLTVSKMAVHQLIKKFELFGSYMDLPRSGKPRKTTVRDDHVMKRIVTRSPMGSVSKVRGALVERGVSVSRMTVSRRLSQELSLKSYKPARKLRLTPAMKAKQLTFAKKHQNWTAKKWDKVMFSDESTLQRFVVKKRHVRRPRGTRFMQKYTIFTIKHPPSQMIWVAISENGVARLFFLPHGTTLNGPPFYCWIAGRKAENSYGSA